MATVAVAVLRPPFDEVEVALAGHPPPVLAEAGGTASFLTVDPGPPLGAGLGMHNWPTQVVPLAPGGVVVFYTDGLVERRDEDLTVGLERLRAAVVADGPAVVCQNVMRAVIDKYAPGDDIALLAMRRAITD
jgi:serine phosphatase RsbU (regulator of sigma subunit)